MHPADIKAALQKAHTSQRKIARALQVADVSVNNVIYGRVTSRRIADFIAQKTGLPLERLWPGRYDKNPDLAA